MKPSREKSAGNKAVHVAVEQVSKPLGELEDVLKAMRTKSVTAGWDAISVYDRSSANRLLQQQYTESYVNGRFMGALNDSQPSVAGITYYYNNLTLGAPMLSFENAQLTDSKARLTMDFVRGSMVRYNHTTGLFTPHIAEVQRVVPVNAPQLFMNITLSKAAGAVGDVGQVTLDLSKGYDVEVDFSDWPDEQQKIGAAFKTWFDGLPETDRTFSLGQIKTTDNGPLTPTSFTLRTVHEENANVLGSDNYGEGAVLMFITMTGGKDGDPAPQSLPWLLPKGCTGAFVLSSRVFFESLLRPHFIEQLPQDADFWPYVKTGNPPFHGEPNTAWSLIAKAGGFQDSTLFELDVLGKLAYYKCDYFLPMANLGSTKVFEVSALNDKLVARWRRTDQPFKYKTGFYAAMEDEVSGEEEYGFSIGADYQASVGEKGVVSFERGTVSTAVTPSNPDTWWADYMKAGVESTILPEAEKMMKGLSVPNIDTFVARNLLFPGHDVMRLKDAYVPGDLYLTADLDPSLLAFTISPLKSVLQAGATFTFTTDTNEEKVKWYTHQAEDRAVPLGSVDLGEIDENTGIYKAPSANSITEGVRHVVIRAEKDGNTAYALVAVMNETLSLRPSFAVVGPSEEFKLTAESLNGETIDWKLLTSEQVSAIDGKNKECMYKAGPPLTEGIFVVDRVEAKTSSGARAEATLLVLNHTPDVEITFVEGSDPASGRVLLHCGYFKGVGERRKWKCETGDSVEWEMLVSGGATVDSEGVLTLPSTPSSEFCIVQAVADDGEKAGFLVLPLPLGSFADVVKAVGKDRPPCAERVEQSKKKSFIE